MKYVYIILCLMFASCATMKTANLDKMNELKRNKILTKVAIENINKYASDYYSENMIQKIDTFIVQEGDNVNRKAYIVGYYENLERREKDYYSVKVWFWSDTGKAYSIMVGSGMGIDIEVAEKSKEPSKLYKTPQPKGWGQ
jgi:hypothetical protein